MTRVLQQFPLLVWVVVFLESVLGQSLRRLVGAVSLGTPALLSLPWAARVGHRLTPEGLWITEWHSVCPAEVLSKQCSSFSAAAAGAREPLVWVSGSQVIQALCLHFPSGGVIYVCHHLIKSRSFLPI